MAADRPFGRGYEADIPVICIGNFVVGGAGKTPLALTLARRLQQMGKSPAFLSRGYGSLVNTPHVVDLKIDDSSKVGDEPLLLAEVAPTIIARDRVAGLHHLREKIKADIVLMDDGFQSAKLKPHQAMLVVDAARGIGNACVLPSGPLRARLDTQMMHTDCIVVIQTGEVDHESTTKLIVDAKAADIPVLYAAMRPTKNTLNHQEKYIAFCGIARPEKFFHSLNSAGLSLIDQVAFPDHHHFSEAEAKKLLEKATMMKARLVTTSKDAARLKNAKSALSDLLKISDVFEIEIVFDDLEKLDHLLSL